MSRNGIKSLTVLNIVIVLLLWSSNIESSCARESRHLRGQISKARTTGKTHRIGRLLMSTSDSKTAPEEAEAEAEAEATFNVLHYGAKGDGRTDDTKAFEAAWAAACEVEASTLIVPSGSLFLVKHVSFSGPNCQSNIIFQLDGKIIAPTSSGDWGSGLLQWIEFTKLQGITVRGKGVIDGEGSVWWNDSPTDTSTQESGYEEDTSNNSSYNTTGRKLTGKMPSTRPTAVRFYGSSNVVVTGITIQNSPRTHLKFDSCTGVQVSDITVSSPGDSPNTDGIHLQNSQDVVIQSSNLACGDDCVSIQTGSSNVYLHDIDCGPGHGISIGGLGRDNTKACVSNITVRGVRMHNTMTGVRIKTWQGGFGSVQGVMFSNIQVSEVEIPVVIDQFYCDQSNCKNETSAVAVSGINYENIKGTYTVKPVHFACSDSLPCTGLSLTTIELKALQENQPLYKPYCWQAYGELKTATVPPIDCLQTGGPSNSPASNSLSCKT